MNDDNDEVEGLIADLQAVTDMLEASKQETKGLIADRDKSIKQLRELKVPYETISSITGLTRQRIAQILHDE